MQSSTNLDQFLDQDLAPGISPQRFGRNHFYLLRAEQGTIPFRTSHSLKDFYMILIVDGRVEFSHGDKVIQAENHSFIFTSPSKPFNIELPEGCKSMYACLFTDTFLEHFKFIRDYPLYRTEEPPLFSIGKQAIEDVRGIFNDIAIDMTLTFDHRSDRIRNNLFKLICIALKCPGTKEWNTRYSKSALRLVKLFTDLLAEQFMVQNLLTPIKMRHPSDFAGALLIHVNHLNRILKSVTGKTTSMLIAEKLIEEARMLLKHTNYTCSEIAWCLGFDGLPNFIHFFKRNVGSTPNSFRKMYAIKD